MHKQAEGLTQPTAFQLEQCNIRDRVAIVTGAGNTHGIGAAVARELARRGAKAIVLVDQNPAVEVTAKDIYHECDGLLTTIDHFCGDVTSEGFCDNVYSKVVERHGLPRILVPAAGITRDGLTARYDKKSKTLKAYNMADLDLVVRVNLIAPIMWAMKLLKLIVADAADNPQTTPEWTWRASNVFIGSISSKGNKGQVSYAATKGGLESASNALNMDGLEHGFVSNIVHPGFTDTQMTADIRTDIMERVILPSIPIRRQLDPREIAEVVCFLINHPYIGQAIWTDGFFTTGLRMTPRSA